MDTQNINEKLPFLIELNEVLSHMLYTSDYDGIKLLHEANDSIIKKIVYGYSAGYKSGIERCIESVKKND
ncbi:MAG: hypothetical protein ACK518_00800 [bacterium]|jgi:hypothetical protein